MSKQNRPSMDERDQKNWGYASNWGILLVYAYTFIKLTYYLFFSDVEKYTFLLWDVLLIFLIAIVIAIIAYKRKTFVLPTTFGGARLKEDSYRNSVKERIIKTYLPHTIMVSIIFAIVRAIMADELNIRSLLLLTAIISVSTFIFHFIFGEISVKLYNRSIGD